MRYNTIPNRHEIEEAICKEAGCIVIRKRSVTIWAITFSVVVSVTYFLSTESFSLFAPTLSVLFVYVSAYFFAGTVKKYRGQAINRIMEKVVHDMNNWKEALEKKNQFLSLHPELIQNKEKIIFNERHPLRDEFADIAELERDLVNMSKILNMLLDQRPKVLMK